MYPKFDWSPFHLPDKWYKHVRYVCGKCGFGEVPATRDTRSRVIQVMRLTAEQHYWRCQHGKDFWPGGTDVQGS